MYTDVTRKNSTGANVLGLDWKIGLLNNRLFQTVKLLDQMQMNLEMHLGLMSVIKMLLGGSQGFGLVAMMISLISMI